MRMQADQDVAAVFEVLVQILDLRRKDMGHRRLNSSRNIDNGLMIRCGLPDIQYGVADLKSILHFGSVKALRTVFKRKIAVGLICKALQKAGAIDGELFDLIFILFEYLFPLRDGGRVVEMDHGARRAFDRFKCTADDVFPRLGQDLNRHIRRDHILLDQSSDKVEFCFGGGRKADFDLLEADGD